MIKKAFTPTNILLTIITLLIFFGFYYSSKPFKRKIDSVGKSIKVETTYEDVICNEDDLPQDEYEKRIKRLEEYKQILNSNNPENQEKYEVLKNTDIAALKILADEGCYYIDGKKGIENIECVKVRKTVQVSRNKYTTYRFGIKIKESESYPKIYEPDHPCNKLEYSY